MFGESGIRLASIVIGIIFIVGLIVLANRFSGQIRQNLKTTKVASSTISPTPTSQPETFTDVSQDTKGAVSMVPATSTIPQTGAETIIIPSLVTLFGVGLKLRKIS